MRFGTILALLLVAAVLPLVVLPLAIVRVVSTPLVVLTVAAVAVWHVRAAVLPAFALFRAPPLAAAPAFRHETEEACHSRRHWRRF